MTWVNPKVPVYAIIFGFPALLLLVVIRINDDMFYKHIKIEMGEFKTWILAYQDAKKLFGRDAHFSVCIIHIVSHGNPYHI